MRVLPGIKSADGINSINEIKHEKTMYVGPMLCIGELEGLDMHAFSLLHRLLVSNHEKREIRGACGSIYCTR
jgi:hypothetical protein